MPCKKCGTYDHEYHWERHLPLVFLVMCVLAPPVLIGYYLETKLKWLFKEKG